MAEEIKHNVEENTEGNGQHQGLPSDNVEPTAFDAFLEDNPDYAFLKDAGSIDEIKAKLEAKPAEHNTETDHEPKPNEVDEADMSATIDSMIPDFINNGMKLTDDMVETLKSKGIDERDIKLGAYEVVQATQEAHALVGGKEVYDEMIGWARESLTEDEAAQFTGEVGGNNRKFAILGLKSMFDASKSGKGAEQTRISGDGSHQTIPVKGYQSKQEMFKDQDYLHAHPSDKAAQRAYQEKLRNTDMRLLR